MSRLTAVLILLVLIAICAAKSSKKSTKSKPGKVIEVHKHKDAKHKNNNKTSTKKHDSAKKESKHHKSTDKATNKTVAAKSSNVIDDKIANKTSSVEKKGNKTQAILAKGTPSDCQGIVEDYSKGKLLMYEYKIQMKRCMNKAKEGDSTAHAKSALLRPDDDSPAELNSDQAVNVRPYNEHMTDRENDNNHDEFRENDNDSDYIDDDDDDDDDDPEENPEKKMQVPGLMGYQSINAPTMNYNFPAQQQVMMPGQQAAPFSSNIGQTQFNAAGEQSPAPVPQQTQAAFAPSATNLYQANPVPLQSTEPNMAMSIAVAKSNIPDNTQPQDTASQANAVFDQWRASSFGEVTAGKKDQTPNAPAVPANDPFAEFMKMQSTSSNSFEAPSASQQAAMPAAVEQRGNIPQQQANIFPMQPQTLNTVPGQGQAFYMQPEENEDFPENP